MKIAGYVILCVGVGLAASFGAKLSPAMDAHATRQGAAALSAQREAQALAAYCEARSEAELPPVEGCPDYEAPEAQEGERTEAEPDPTYDGLLAHHLVVEAGFEMNGDHRHGCLKLA